MKTKFEQFIFEIFSYKAGDYVLLNFKDIPEDWGLYEFAKIKLFSVSDKACLTTCLDLKRNNLENFWFNNNDFIRKLTPDEIKLYEEKKDQIQQIRKYNL